MTGLDDDRELDDFLARRSMLHRRLADRDRTDPPPDLDRLVLDKAREAIQTPSNLPVHRAPRWAVPVGLAATVVIAFTVVMSMAPVRHNDSAQLASSASPAADAAGRMAETGESVEAERSTATGIGANQLRIQMEKRASSPAAPAAAFDAKPSEATLALNSQPSNEPHDAVLAAASEPAADAAVNARAGATSADATRNSASTLAKSRAAAAPVVAMPHAVAKASGAAEAPQSLVASNTPARGGAYLEPASAPRSAYAPAPGERRAIVPAKSEMTASNAAADRAERESATQTGSLQASDSAIVAQVPPAAAPPLARASAPAAAVTGPTNDARSSAGAAASAASAPLSAAVTSADAANTPVLSDEAKHANPQAWLREIEALRTAGKTAEANRELAEFRKAFPKEASQLPPSHDSRPVQ